MNEDETDNGRNQAAWFAYFELVRLPNVFTAMADVAMGFLYVCVLSNAAVLTPVLLVVASSLLYMSGMVLNDVFDVETDRRERPERPLPSGRISLGAARWLGWELWVLGLAVAWTVAFREGTLRPGIVASILAGTIVLYDAWLKRTPLGPLAMGTCRGLNVLLGMSVAAVPWATEHWLIAGGIGTYITGVTWFARTEAHRSRQVSLALALVVLLAGVGLLAWFPSFRTAADPVLLRQWHWLIGILGLLIAWPCLRAVLDPGPIRVQMAVRQCILSLVILDASVCYVARGMFWATMIVLLLLPALLFGRWLDST